MKIYLCGSCNKTVPLSELATHRKACGPDAELALKADRRMKIRKALGVLFAGISLVALAAASFLLGRGSFDAIAHMRQLERVPATDVHAVLPGEVNLTGKAQPVQDVLQAPDSGTTCLYYRYVVEKRTTDSDGNTKWQTIRDEQQFLDFRLVDPSGGITVKPTRAVDFTVKESFSRRSGNRRYKEYRIDPGDQVFLFGYVVPHAEGYEIRFDKPGAYKPIISERTEARERLGMAGLSVGLCWGGLVCLAFAIGLAAWMLRLHRLIVYFLLLSVVLAVYLSVLGLQMMQADLESGAERLARHEAAARQAIQGSLASTSFQWDGTWSDLGDIGAIPGLGTDAVQRLQRIRLDLALAVDRFRLQRQAFPERILAPAWGVEVPARIPLPEEQARARDDMSRSFQKATVPPLVGWIVIGGALLAGMVLAAIGIRRVRNKRCMENVPTSRTTGAAYGLCELKGLVELAQEQEPLSGPLTHLPCIQYHYTVKERRRSGKKTKWVTILDEQQACPFVCRDAEGGLKIDPQGATVYSEHRATKRSGKWRYAETRLELKDPLYAIGECVVDETSGETLKLQKPEGDDPFILSNMTEARVMHKVATTGVILLNLAFSALLLAALVLFGLSGSFAATDYMAAALITPGFMIFVMLTLHYNDLVFLRERVERNWSNIEVSLKKRHDLIPNLERVVKNYMAHESGLQESIAAMRAAFEQRADQDPDSTGTFMEAEQKAAQHMLGLMEAYPALKANETVSLLMGKMLAVENELALMRSGYNQAVETYNTRIAVIPDVVFAKAFGFREQSFLHAEADVIRMPVSVQDSTRKAVAAGGEANAATAAVSPAPADGSLGRTEPERAAASDGRAVLYALLLQMDPDIQQAQLDTIGHMEGPAMRDKTASLIEAVAKEVTNPVARLETAEEWLPKLLALQPSEHDVFVGIVRKLMEQDDEISLFEYALSKSIDRRLEPAFAHVEERPARYQDLTLLTEQASRVLSCFAQAEDAPDTRAQAAFEEGIAALAHEPKSDFVRMPAAACGLAPFDAALDELALAAVPVKQNILDACLQLIRRENDDTWGQAMLAAAVADTFGLERPAAIKGDKHGES